MSRVLTPNYVISNLKKKNIHLVILIFLCECHEKRNKYLDLVRELRKLWNMRMTVVPVVVGALGKRAEKVGNRRAIKDYPNNSIVKIGKNYEKSLEDLKKRSITKTPLK